MADEKEKQQEITRIEIPEEPQSEARRRKRDPFANMAQVSSSEAGLRGKDLATKSDIQQIKKARVKYEGKRIVTDDVKKLKSLSVEPRVSIGDEVNYYIEPVKVEFYIPRESRFAVETKYLYIPLIDPVPRPGKDAMLKHYMDSNRFMDLMDVMNEYPQFITYILEAYDNTMDLYESLARAIRDAESGESEKFKTAFYLVEVLSEYEPTYAALEILGNFHAWNLNWLVRKMNSLQVEFAASDKTVSYFIKLRNQYWEENNYDYDERFEILAALFFEQAYPNRGALIEQDDYFYDIFDKRK